MNVLNKVKEWLYLSREMQSDSVQPLKRDNSGPSSIKQLLLQAANDRSSGYGDHHSGYGGGHHSGYGDDHSSYGHYGGYGHDDGYGSHSGYGKEPCCPPVIDPLTLIALLCMSIKTNRPKCK